MKSWPLQHKTTCSLLQPLNSPCTCLWQHDANIRTLQWEARNIQPSSAKLLLSWLCSLQHNTAL